MAKVLKDESALDVAVCELANLRNRLDKAQRNRAQHKEELETRWAERLGPNTKGVDGQRRSIELRALLNDEEEICVALAQKIEDRQQDIKTLTKDKARNDANGMVAVAMEEFEDVMAAFAGPVSTAEEWLRKSNEAAGRYASCNPGLGRVNQKLQPKIATVLAVLREIENGRRV